MSAREHRAPCVDGDVCGEDAHCPPTSSTRTAGVNDESGTSFLPDGADDAPNQSKGRDVVGSAPVALSTEPDADRCGATYTQEVEGGEIIWHCDEQGAHDRHWTLVGETAYVWTEQACRCVPGMDPSRPAVIYRDCDTHGHMVAWVWDDEDGDEG